MPILDLASFGAVGVRKDGGVDLVISCDGLLDELPATLEAFGPVPKKVESLLEELQSTVARVGARIELIES